MSAQLRWFRFRQNNSGGYFKAPAVNVFIEALDERDAEARANYIGLSNAGSCPCCGDRWNGCEEAELPEVFEVSYFGGFCRDEKVPEAVRFAHGDDDGVVMPIRKQTKEEFEAEREKWRAAVAKVEGRS